MANNETKGTAMNPKPSDPRKPSQPDGPPAGETAQADASTDDSTDGSDETAQTGASPDTWEHPTIDGKTVCGFPVPQGTEQDGRVKPTKPCLKDVGHDGNHVSRKYTKLDLSAVTADMLGTMEDVPTAEADIKYQPVGIRDERQAGVDAAVLLAHNAWKGSHPDAKLRPQSITDAIKRGVAKRYFIPLEVVDAVKKLLKNAADFHDVKVHIDKPRRHTDGRTMLYWYVSDQPAPSAPAGPAAPATTPAS